MCTRVCVCVCVCVCVFLLQPCGIQFLSLSLSLSLPLLSGPASTIGLWAALGHRSPGTVRDSGWEEGGKERGWRDEGEEWSPISGLPLQPASVDTSHPPAGP